MSLTVRSLQLWLPALAHFEPGHPLREWLARADRLAAGGKGYFGGLADHFSSVDAKLTAAAITRQFLAGDAADGLWLSADPAWIQPDMNGVRLLACGRMQLDRDAAQALAEALRPVFEEVGMQLEVSTPDHWHLRLPADISLPDFAAPAQALGEDLAQHLPQGPEGRRWRVLLNDIQVLLHQHPLNRQRQARGLSPVNSLWLWGGGRLPTGITTQFGGVISDDVLLRALASLAGITQQARSPETIATSKAGSLIDLQDLPARDIATHWWPCVQPLLEQQPVLLQFASGERWQRKPWHRWRVWRRVGR
ncbi:phosphoglycerate mutase [Rhodanobacter sp. AS-Z3]|uniref:phosphoglycerate mutase n=1 Tax=Rhodanobacter sp. AS-Z3 TaxID=3031330 RepID=UPI002478AEE5|nr:phosphoglycerate mutase [Rhodanobacter sp. AS-Z3]WEN13728.1 phosphoglycerate mutase [Rhodanobacter sp. AS-Z3]